MIIVDDGQRSGLPRGELSASVRVLDRPALASVTTLLVSTVTG